jgi:hypothetical protein
MVVLVWQRHRVLDLSCLGSFFLSHLVMVLSGVTAAPWLINSYFRTSFAYITWDVISDRDLLVALAVEGGGLALVLLGHIATDLLLATPTGRLEHRWGSLLRAPGRLPLGTWPIRVRLTYLVLAAGVLLLFLTRWSAFSAGLQAGYFRQEIETQYSARESMQELGRPYFLVVLNALPFLTVLLWMFYRAAPRLGRAVWAFGSVGVTSFFLFATFQKRPLVLFALTVLVAHVLAELYAGRLRLRIPLRFPTRPGFWFSQFPWRWVAIGLAFPVLLLVGFYYLSTTVAAKLGFTVGTLLTLLGIVALRLFGRLSIMPVLYAHFYPAIHPHYGLANVGLLSAIMGRRVYHDTVDVFRYFTTVDSGAGAIGALMDAFAAFGWGGWALFAFLLGAGLNALDRWLRRLPGTLLNRCFYLFMIVFVSSLSQASLSRSLSTYGGLMFLGMWVYLRITVAKAAPGASPVQQQAA